jgi:DNA-3-methyladenine glycosylase
MTDMWWPSSAVTAAPVLLGAILRRGPVAVRITEVEAYEGQLDPASHAYPGLTQRNKVMFGPPGRLYTYRLHGHTCANVVVSPSGKANAVLIRAGAVIDGVEVARERRPGVADDRLARGPGNLCRTLDITMADAGAELLEWDSTVTLTRGESVTAISQGPRVGVSRAADLPWRFWITGEGSVSAYRRSPRAPVVTENQSTA